MKKVFLAVSLFIAAMTFSSCESCTREKTTEEKIEDAAEAVADDIEDAFDGAADAIEDAFDDAGNAIEDAAEAVERKLD